MHTAAAEVGQGLITLQQQIARTELGVETVTIRPADTSVGSAGSSSASRQSYMSGGAVKLACEAVRARVAGWSAHREVTLVGGKVLILADGVVGRPGRPCSATTPIEETAVFRHRPTVPLDPTTGQGNSHVQLALCVHRATVDVDVELGLVKVVELAAVQDVGRIMNRIVAGGPDPRRHRAGARAGADGGDPGSGRPGPQPVLHRLPDPDHPRHAADAAGDPRVPRPARALRPARRRRTADALVHAGDRRPRSATPPACRCAGCRSAPSTSPAAAP